MSANYNRVILAGNLTRDPELSYTPNNTAICKFGMAINRKWTPQGGEAKEEMCFVDCVTFGRQAETLNQYMRKGRPVLIEGRLTYSAWEGQDGKRRSKLEVTVERFQFLGGKDDAPAETKPAAVGAGGWESPTTPSDGLPAPDDDSPF